MQLGESASAKNWIIIRYADVLLISSQQTLSTAGTGNNTFTLLNGRWDFTDTFGNNGPMLMSKEELRIGIRDDLSLASFFKVSCHGILVEEN